MRHDPAKSWMWTREQVSAGAVEDATRDEVLAIFVRLVAEQPGHLSGVPKMCPVRAPDNRFVARARAGMARIVIITGHVKSPSFCDALSEAYRAGAVEGGHTAQVFATARMTFDPILHEGFARIQPAAEGDLVEAHAAIAAADHLVIVFPLWLGDMPAILKGFLERVLQGDVLPGAQAGKFVTPLKGKSARIVVTNGHAGLHLPVLVPSACRTNP